MAEEKEIDSYGRIVLPKTWRGRRVWLLDRGTELKIIPREGRKLTDFIDKVKVDVSDLSDYHRVKEEILTRRGSREDDIR